ncbi:MAG: Asp-tRNA(Asn)/Glu-tRNA(Gln) amidotransferase subunit GatA [Planctomycetota bacterium]|jgi:aspartyl-tRNA(Asn)/glutamyl-tRNA(Gln) amidotransferase subunit A|nr:Asp-tRNA(Asn)/Glu-tRNA(Gln) amidotransferase subunit GatA [Planctomycetota bacterium]MDP7255075.1 Asp-tRNA(Asn)/Glu-tRNA(Gln) amidotransferase subunit GatA [Planctomycetota bacterium]
MNLEDFTATELAEKIRHKEVSAAEAVGGSLEQIRKHDDQLNAFLNVCEDATENATRIDERLAAGEDVGPLAGVPIALKDNMCVQGTPTTCASKILEHWMSPYDAHVTDLLEKAGAVIVGKTNMDEYAMGSSTENSGLALTRNPWNTEHAPGGSSGGSAAAVASGMVPLALGSDTGGSIRQPAAFCGVTGSKPTYGRVSRFGLVAFGSSLDQIGPLSRDVRDNALLLQVISGHDTRDSTSANLDVPDYLASLDGSIDGLKIGIPKEYFVEGMSPDVAAATEAAIETLRSLGAETREISMPHTQYAVAVYYIIATAEASSNLSRYDGVHYGFRSQNAEDMIEMYTKSRQEAFGDEVKRRIMLGTFALSAETYEAYYLKAAKVRKLMRQDFDHAFEEVDCILSPTAPSPAFKIGELVDDPLEMYLSDILTLSLNLAGLPGISVPCGFSARGLPLGLQIMGKPWDEATVLRAAHAFQENTDFLKRPTMPWPQAASL